MVYQAKAGVGLQVEQVGVGLVEVDGLGFGVKVAVALQCDSTFCTGSFTVHILYHIARPAMLPPEALNHETGLRCAGH